METNKYLLILQRRTGEKSHLIRYKAISSYSRMSSEFSY
jgi:hypothetical protein